MPVADGWGLFDAVKDFSTSVFFDTIFGAVGAAAGGLIAVAIIRGRSSPWT
jgi:hypothetical protein